MLRTIVLRLRSVALATLVALTAGACHRSSPNKTASVGAALDTHADNTWQLIIGNLSNKPLSSTLLMAPQSSTTPQALFQQAQGILQQGCQGDTTCLSSLLSLTLLAENVTAPPPPERPYSYAVVSHFRDGVQAEVQFLSSDAAAAVGAESARDSLYRLSEAVAAVFGSMHSIQKRYDDLKQAIIDEASQKIKDKATPIVGAEMVALATAKQKSRELKAIYDLYTASAQPLSVDYALVARQYASYRAGELDTIAKLTKLSADASAVDLAGFGALQDQLLAIDATESRLPENLLVLTYRLIAQLTEIQSQFDVAVQPYLDFMKQHGIARPDVTSVPLHSLDAMRAYTLAREDNVRQAVGKLIDGLVRRAQVLVVQSADAKSLPSIVQAQQLASSAKFVEQLNARMSNLWTTPVMSTTLQLPFEGAQLDRITTFLQLEGVCSDPNAPSYMQTGCKLMQPQLSRAHTFIKTGLPSTIRLDLYFLGQAGADAAAIAAVQTELKAGQLERAVLDHDALLHASDVPTPPAGGVDGGSPAIDESEDD